MPLITKFHHSQLPATPLVATRPVTTSGVSAAKVVATMAVAASHQGGRRPAREYQANAPPPRRAGRGGRAPGGAGQPPGRLAPREEVLVEAPPAAAGEVEADDGAED